MNYISLVMLLLVLGACTKSEVVEKVVEKPAEVPATAPVNEASQEPGTTVNGQPAQTPIVIATGSDMEVDTGSGPTATPEPVAPVVEPVSQTTSAPAASPPLVWAQYLTGLYSGLGTQDGKGIPWWARDVGITDLSTVSNLAAYPSTPASSNRAYGVAVDVAKRIMYFSDVNNHSIRQLNLSTGQVTTIAGGATLYSFGIADGAGRNARFNAPMGIALSPDKKYLYVADTKNHAIRRLTVETGVVVTYAGVPMQPGFTEGTRLPPYIDAPSMKFNSPQAVAVADDGTLYVSDTGNKAIRAIAPDTETKVGESSTLIKAADSADLFMPDQILVEGATMYIADQGDDVLWKVDIPTKTKTAVAGKYKMQGNLVTEASVSASCPAVPDPARPECVYGDQARFLKMVGVAKVGNKLYTNDYSLSGNSIFEIDLDKSALVTRIIGTPQGTYGVTDGPFKDARLRSSSHMAYDATANAIYNPQDLAFTVRKIDLGQQVVSTLVGFNAYNATPDNSDTDIVPALKAKISAPWHMVFLSDDKILVVDQSNCRVRIVNLDPNFGAVVTDANGARRYNNDNTVGTFAGTKSSCVPTITVNKLPLPHPETDANGPGEFYWPLAIAINDDKTEVYVAGSKIIQKVNAADPTQVKVLAGTAHAITSTDGVGKDATFSDHRDMKFVAELQADGTTKPALYVLDANAIRRISLDEADYGTVTTVAGSNSRVGHVDGRGSEAAFLGASRMTYVKRGSKQYLYVVESPSMSSSFIAGGNNDVREVLLIDNGEKKYDVKTVAGSGLDESRDGNGLRASFSFPRAVGHVTNPDGTVVLYIFEGKSALMRKLDLQTLDVTTVSGSGLAGYRDGVNDKASWIYTVSDIIYHPKHNRLFVLDSSAIRLLGPELPGN